MKKIIFLLSIGLSFLNAREMTLDDVLELATENSERIQYINLMLESLDAEMKSRELVLSPSLTSELAVFKDERETASPTSNRGGTSGLFNLTLEKPFATGTKTTATISHDSLGAGPRNASGDLNIAAWNLRVSQSLWRDAFGEGTRLRRAAETAEEKARRLSAYYEKQVFLTQVETLYWDLVYALKEHNIRQKNLERSIALEKWSQTRVQQFASEPADLLQVQTLLSTRRLDLTTSLNAIEIARNNLKVFIPNIDPKNWRLNLNSLETDRRVQSLLTPSDAPAEAPITRMDALAESYRGEQLKSQALNINDSLKPELDIYASYGANGINETWNRSWNKSIKAETPSARVGLLLSFDMDTGLKNEQRNAARLAATAQESRARGLKREALVAWEELARNIENLKAQVNEARSLSHLQNKKVTTERTRYEQGRTTTLQMTTFEVDAAESELRLYRLLTNLRKAESMARIFVRDGERSI